MYPKLFCLLIYQLGKELQLQRVAVILKCYNLSERTLQILRICVCVNLTLILSNIQIILKLFYIIPIKAII